MANEGDFPKTDGDTLFASEVNSFEDDKVATVIAGEGIDVSGATGDVTISGENATTSNKGISSFNSTDFSVSSGAVSLKNKTSYWSTVGLAFLPDNSTGGFDRFTSGRIQATSSNIFYCPVNLPDNVNVQSCQVWGNDSVETWELRRKTTSTQSTTSIMASANIQSSDSSIADSIIDNVTYSYFLQTSQLNSGDEIFGAKITYTTDYD